MIYQESRLNYGAASGIGYGMAKRLAECGANVALCDIQTDIHDIASEIAKATDNEVKAAVVGVRETSQVFTFTNEVVDEFLGLDIVVANAGVWISTDPLEDTMERAVSDWDLLR